jgi:hypothetical protein
MVSSYWSVSSAVLVAGPDQPDAGLDAEVFVTRSPYES